ncbi:MAG: hypothetical protein MZV63_46015 [Marinilabiliales bacterium]|nr:hypothetical protein [Marinilabiliales bacterium]
MYLLNLQQLRVIKLNKRILQMPVAKLPVKENTEKQAAPVNKEAGDLKYQDGF